MASTSSKTPCVTCGKGTGLFKCQGCLQTFCTKHVVEHRQTLHHQLDEIIVEHDTLQEIIIDNKDRHHPLVDYIDKWELTSIKKIQQMAKKTREQVTEIAHIDKSKCLNKILIVKYVSIFI